MAITILPQRKSGGELFKEAFDPYLQLAFQAMMKRKMEEQDFQTRMQRNIQASPELFAPTPEMVSAPRGFENMPGAVNGQIPVKPAIPKSYQFLQNKAPVGSEFNATTGELGFKQQRPEKSMEEILGLFEKKEEIKNQAKKDSPIIKKQKMKDVSDLYTTEARLGLTNKRIETAMEEVNKLPQGLYGKVNIGLKKMFSPRDPILGTWQDIKSLLSDLQLGKLQFTKGAISDAEMEFFAKAVANDDFNSTPRILSILNRASQDNNAEIEAKRRAFIANYEEDPDSIVNYTNEPSNISQSQTGWTPEKESRYQELLNKQRGK